MNKRKIITGAVACMLLLAAGCSSGNKYATNNAMPQTASSSYSSNTGGSSALYDGGYNTAVNESAAYDSYDTSVEMEKPMYGMVAGESGIMPEEAASAGGGAQIKPDKIIQTANIEMQTDRFDDVSEQLRRVAIENGGYVENANLYNRYNYNRDSRWRVFSITLRVPTDKFEEVRQYVEGLGHVLSAVQNADDVTAQYYDIVSRLETKQIEEERVLDMITRANQIDDLLALEERLGQIRTQIERYQSQINSIDRLAAYSTIQVGLSEVTKEELVIVSDNLGGRIQKAFLNSLNKTASFFQEVLIFLAGALIPLAIVGLLAFIGIKAALTAHHKHKQP